MKIESIYANDERNSLMGGKYIVEVEAHNEKEPLHVGTYSQLHTAHEAATQEARKRWGDSVHILADDADLDLIVSYCFGERHALTLMQQFTDYHHSL